MAEEKVENGKQDPVVKLNFSKKPKEPAQEEEQDASQDDKEALDWNLEVCSAIQVFSFFSKYFNNVGGDLFKMTWEDAYAIGHIFNLCEERLRRIQL